MDTALFLVMFGWFAGSFVSGLCGLGGALMAMPLLLLALPMHDAVLVSCLVGLPLMLVRGCYYLRHCRRDVLLHLLLGVIPGSFIGLYGLKTLSGQVLQICLGILIVGFSLHLFFGTRLYLKERPWTNFLVGLLGGAVATAISTDGPIIALYGLMAAWPPQTFLAITSGYYCCRSIISCFLQWQAGLYTQEILHYALLAVPAALTGFALSVPIVKRMRTDRFRTLVQLVLLLAGASCLVRAF